MMFLFSTSAGGSCFQFPFIRVSSDTAGVLWIYLTPLGTNAYDLGVYHIIRNDHKLYGPALSSQIPHFVTFHHEAVVKQIVHSIWYALLFRFGVDGRFEGHGRFHGQGIGISSSSHRQRAIELCSFHSSKIIQQHIPKVLP